MSEQDQPTKITERSDESDRILGPKSWTALIVIMLVLCSVVWIVVSVLTARPAVDPTVHADAIALAKIQQPDPDAPNRYPELIEAVIDFEHRVDEIAQTLPNPPEQDQFGRFVVWHSLLDERDMPMSDTATLQKQATVARQTIEILETEFAFQPADQLLRSGNLANTYPEAFDDTGNLKPLIDWEDLSSWHLRDYADASAARARNAFEAGDLKRSAVIARNVSAIAATLTKQALATEHLVGWGVAGIAIGDIERLAVHGDLTPEALTQLRFALADLNELGDPKTFLQGSLIDLRDALSRTHTSSGRYIPSIGEAFLDDLYDIEPPRDQSSTDRLLTKMKDAAGYRMPRRDAVLSAVEGAYATYSRAIDEPEPQKREALLSRADDEISAADEMNEVLFALSPRWSFLINTYFETRARITALAILLAMAEYRLDHGDWPDSLDQLVPDYLDAIPINPLTGKPFEYDYEPGQPPSLERLGVGI